jgi:UDP-N-acetylmuramate dehydrogenase
MSHTPGKNTLAPDQEPGLEIKQDMALARLTTIGTGGKARLFIRVQTMTALKRLMPKLEQPWFVLGAGSNLLVSDREYPGTIIQLGQGFRRLIIGGGRILCGAAVPLSRLVNSAIDAGFPGFEELSGIPGTLGGAADMNAGTHLKEISELAHTLLMVDTGGKKHSFSSNQLQHLYRNSLAPLAGVVTAMTFLQQAEGHPDSQRRRAEMLTEQRRTKHPWRKRTFGSTFKNPPGRIAAELIDDAGLKDSSIGEARVSPVHANFIENLGNAASLDVLELIKYVRRTVQQRFGVNLEPEVRLLGFTEEELGELSPYALSLIDSHNGKNSL